MALFTVCNAVVVIPAAHALAVGLAGLHTAAVASFHAAAGAKLAGAAIHAAGQAAPGALSGAAAGALSGTLTAGTLTAAPAAFLVNAPAGTRVLTDVLRRPEKPASARAVGRIIQAKLAIFRPSTPVPRRPRPTYSVSALHHQLLTGPRPLGLPVAPGRGRSSGRGRLVPREPPAARRAAACAGAADGARADHHVGPRRVDAGGALEASPLQPGRAGGQSRCDAHAAYMQPQGAHTCNQVVQMGMQSRCDAHAAYMQPQGAHTCNQVVQVGAWIRHGYSLDRYGYSLGGRACAAAQCSTVASHTQRPTSRPRPTLTPPCVPVLPSQARVPHIWAAVRALEVELTSRAPPP